ncbi:ribonuclease T1 [Saccharopolyspora erythraea NRRL 2338]|uniref:Guanine-specific ribonuclease N1 and T1 n=2 Tax=Saccharopolyspora erythraea TaxID=1836 RepID=A4FMK3_SACEN|nr:ribonuclease [Saccharopolyspora erythraea]EQD85531.1 ribonuclease [Saccharopolyspora erythraea D]PFG98926.1 ribonuclease T1 [Saccharopolyspora erythraea NRRL 2338]QRK88910.1 ribonuclease [Saccharopolyspora erythraea]QUH04548.1 ribonuclease [Saccharopolyspora erythraea]CAM05278.1 guanine-specific ribonuclease N1 and T1 [Saccharopolyspora erythraea NRRL 2338]
MRRITKSNAVRTLLAGLIAVVGLLGFQAGAVQALPVAPQAPAAAQAPCGDTSGFEQVRLADLPPEATDTYELIQKGGPYPYPQDGTVFQNREGILPDCAEGYYHEYTVKTPGSDDRGARRFVVGDGGEYFYTEDHYESFRLTIVN